MRAMGTGTSDYAGPSQSVATGQEEHATVIAFKLGTCHGQLMYQAVEWYFPSMARSSTRTGTRTSAPAATCPTSNGHPPPGLRAPAGTHRPPAAGRPGAAVSHGQGG
jgi:hypothetical protein